jgi:hypothetical protein
MIKPSIILAVLIAGLAVGWFVGRSQATRSSHEEAEKAARRSAEGEQSLAADYALMTIPLIERGDTNRAIERLSRIVAVYYHNYASDPGTNEWRLRGRRIIDEMASTNAILASMLKQIAGGE